MIHNEIRQDYGAFSDVEIVLKLFIFLLISIKMISFLHNYYSVQINYTTVKVHVYEYKYERVSVKNEIVPQVQQENWKTLQRNWLN